MASGIKDKVAILGWDVQIWRALGRMERMN